MFNRLFSPESKRKRAKGFTLVELLLVIAILGVIAGIAVPTLVGHRRRARVIGDAMSNAKALHLALESRKAEMGVYATPGTYLYNANGTIVGANIVPTFSPKGNSKMNYSIVVANNGLTYVATVTDPTKPDTHVLTIDQTGGVEENKRY